MNDLTLSGQDGASTHLCHVVDAISSPSKDGGLDASFLQGFVGEDPVFQAVGALTGFAKEDPPRLHVRTKLFQQYALKFEHLWVLIAGIPCQTPQLHLILCVQATAMSFIAGMEEKPHCKVNTQAVRTLEKAHQE